MNVPESFQVTLVHELDEEFYGKEFSFEIPLTERIFMNVNKSRWSLCASYTHLPPMYRAFQILNKNGVHVNVLRFARNFSGNEETYYRRELCSGNYLDGRAPAPMENVRAPYDGIAHPESLLEEVRLSPRETGVTSRAGTISDETEKRRTRQLVDPEENLEATFSRKIRDTTSETPTTTAQSFEGDVPTAGDDAAAISETSKRGASEDAAANGDADAGTTCPSPPEDGEEVAKQEEEEEKEEEEEEAFTTRTGGDRANSSSYILRLYDKQLRQCSDVAVSAEERAVRRLYREQLDNWGGIFRLANGRHCFVIYIFLLENTRYSDVSSIVESLSNALDSSGLSHYFRLKCSNNTKRIYILPTANLERNERHHSWQIASPNVPAIGELYKMFGWQISPGELVYRSETETLAKRNVTIGRLSTEYTDSLNLINFILSSDIVERQIIGKRRVQALVRISKIQPGSTTQLEQVVLSVVNLKRLATSQKPISRILFKLGSMEDVVFNLPSGGKIVITLTCLKDI